MTSEARPPSSWEAGIERPEGSSTDVRTFLIADVRGYTKYTQEHGDEAAARLASIFADLVREVVEAHQGFLLELRGDEALVVFVSARNALRAAVAIQNRLREENLPRGVGIGLDAGEAIPVGEGYRGGALNLAARLCSQAAAGEVLASETVIHLAAKIDGISYIDPRMLKLKGYPEPVRAIEVTPDDRVRRAFSRRATRMRRRIKRATTHKLRIGIVVIVLALIAVALPVALRTGGSALEKLPAGIALLDAKSGRKIAVIPQSVVKSPSDAIYADGEFWVLNRDPVSFVGIDPRTGRILQQIASPIHNAGGYTVDNGTLWVTGDSPYLFRIDVRSGQETGRFGLGVKGADTQGGDSVVVVSGSVWVTHRASDFREELLRLDPSTGKVLNRIKVFANADASGSWALGVGDGSVWSVAQAGMNRIDPQTYAVVRAKISGIPEGFVAAGGGFGWTADEAKGVVYKVGQNGDLVATYETGEGARNVSYSAGTLWVANTDAGTASAIDAITGTQRRFEFRHPLASIAAGSGSVLVELNSGRTYEDRIDALKGKVAKLMVPLFQFDPNDPALNGSPLAFQVESATCARLLNYPDVVAPDGARLKPEIAAAMPLISAGGRTYTFTVRSGYRFSPPSNQPVTAETFRYSIERALSRTMGSDTPGPRFVPDIAGEDAFRSGRAEHISGLVASGDTLAITLKRPSGDFLARLAIPFFCPVPTDSASIPEGEARSVSDGDALGDVAVPSAGPYYLADSVKGEYTILKRNPNYNGPRPHVLDAIALREGIDPGLAVARVEKQTWDGVTKLDDPVILSPYGSLASQWGPASAAAAKGDQRYYSAPRPAVDYLAFNAGRPLFSNVVLRRAAAYAINRIALAKPFDEIPTAQLLPSDMAGYSAHDPYPLEASDLAHAQVLAKGRGRRAVMVINSDCDPCRQFARAVREALATIGIGLTIHEVSDPFAEAQDPKTDADLFNAFYASEGLSDPASFLTSLFDERVPSGWVPASVRSAISKLDPLTGEAREQAAGNLAMSLATADVPLAAFGTPVIGEFFSPRLGCKVFPPFGFGVDLAALCLK